MSAPLFRRRGQLNEDGVKLACKLGLGVIIENDLFNGEICEQVHLHFLEVVDRLEENLVGAFQGLGRRVNANIEVIGNEVVTGPQRAQRAAENLGARWWRVGERLGKRIRAGQCEHEKK